jgi:glutamate carboxypeptidase
MMKKKSKGKSVAAPRKKTAVQKHDHSKPSAAVVTRTAPPLQYFEERRELLVNTIRQMVEIESPTDNKQAVDRLGRWLATKFDALGGHSKFHRALEFGDHLQVDFPGRSRRSPVLLLGHLDTVYPLGTLAGMPCRVEDGRLWGPGTLDMKSGIAFMLLAIDALRDQGGTLPRPVTVLLVSDEEVGSSSSRRITEEVAKRSGAVLVLEPSYGLKGAVKTARKGVGEYLLKVKGKAAHAGLDFTEGHSAILELARQIERISKFTDLKRGLTVNVGLVQGGTRVNVIPAGATASIDVRIARGADGIAIEKKLRTLKTVNRQCKLELTGGIDRPPMERTAGVAGLFNAAALIAKELGWKLLEAAVGGGSDGNLTAALGIPTLDGLGGVGEGAHATHESVLISELPRRTALLAGLIESV